VKRALLEWYRPRRRAYPWRIRPTPYRVLVSEVMLQQTQAARVAPAFRSFIRRFSTVRALAGAPRADVIGAWGTLGYNRRALALANAAREIVGKHGGRVPRDVEALRSLPGVGPYTAAAVAALAFGRPIPALDVNVRRVVSRVRLGFEPVESGVPAVDAAAAAWLDRRDPGSWNQALMDLGREVCRPVPRCGECPLAPGCRFRGSGRTPAPPARRQGRYEGSFRKVRGGVMAELRARSPVSLGALARAVEEPPMRVAAAVRSLAADGLVSAGSAALSGRPNGLVRLPD
jgi:A/G-specific adenine glycosylase